MPGCTVDVCYGNPAYWANQSVCYTLEYTYVNGYEPPCTDSVKCSKLRWNAYLPAPDEHDCNLQFQDYLCWDGYVDPFTVWISNPWWHNAIKYQGKISDRNDTARGVWVAHELLIADSYSNRAWSTRPVPCTSDGCTVDPYRFGSSPTKGTCFTHTCDVDDAPITRDCNLDNAGDCGCKLYDRDESMQCCPGIDPCPPVPDPDPCQ